LAQELVPQLVRSWA
jgi:hypothetical protein